MRKYRDLGRKRGGGRSAFQALSGNVSKVATNDSGQLILNLTSKALLLKVFRSGGLCMRDPAFRRVYRAPDCGAYANNHHLDCIITPRQRIMSRRAATM